MKQFVKDNRQVDPENQEELQRKKILFIMSEINFDLIVFDCIEDG